MSRGKSRVKKHNASQIKTRNKSQKNVKIKVRTCDECNNVVANGSDMYRFHRTGLTVCKSCWITMDPNRDKGKRRSRNSTETKLCTVFLTDVLSEGSHNEKIYKLEKDEDGNNLYVIRDDSSEERSSGSSASPKLQDIIDDSSKKRGKKRRINISQSDIESTPVKATKSNTQMRVTRSIKSSETEESPNVPMTQQAHKKTMSTASSDSDAQTRPKKMRGRPSNNRTKLSSPASPASPASSAESAKRSNRKRLRSETHSEHSDESCNDGNQSRKKKNVSSTSATTIKSEVEIKRETRSRTRSSSISSTEMPLKGFRSPKFKEAKASLEMKTEYACDKCSKKFDNKISSAEHKLTHLKQITLKLERVNIDSEEKEEKKVDSQEDETMEAETPSSRSASIDKHGDDPSEEIGISIEDDTDDEEIFNFSKSKIKIDEKSKCDENEGDRRTDAIDKDTKENESQKTEEESQKIEEESQKTEEEFTKTQDNKDVEITKTIKETKQNPTTIISSDKSITPNETEEKNADNKNDKDQDNKVTSEAQDMSKDKENVKEDVTIILAEDNQETEECEKIDATETENDADVIIKEEEKQSISKCNNDTENVEKTTTCNDETKLESLVHKDEETTKIPITNHDEDSANESQNNCRNDEDEKTEKNAKTVQDDLEKESQKKSNDKKDKKDTLDITNKAKASNDEKHLDDNVTIADEIEVAASKQQQNGDIMVNTSVEKSSSTEDVKPNLLNCEKLDGPADDLEEKNDVTLAPLTNNNDATKTDVSEEKDDNPEKNDKLEESVKSLEKLIKETVASEECEMQENSNHAATSNNSPANAANEILSEVFDLAAAEVQKREDNKIAKNLDDTEMETLENISREIHNSADMASLDPMTVVKLDNDNDDGITLD